MNKFVLKPILVLAAVLILSFVVVGLVNSQISDLRSKVLLAKKDAKVLSDKLANLEDVEISIDDTSAYALSALPTQNAVLLSSAQLKRTAIESGLFMSSLSTSGSVDGPSGLKYVDLSFDLEGPRQLIFDFTQRVGFLAPLTTIEKIEVDQFGGVAKANISVRTYFAEPPKKLPALTENSGSLTQAEQDLLFEIQSLSQPLFVSIPASGVISTRSDPF